MRFKLRTLLFCVTVAACCLGAWSWKKYFEWRSLIPVDVRTAPLLDYRPATEVRVRFGSDEVEALRLAHLKWKAEQESLHERPRDLEGLLAEPVYYEDFGGEALTEMGIDAEATRAVLLERLACDEYEDDFKVSYALILIELDERTGLDWILDRVGKGDVLTSARREYRAFTAAPAGWLDDVDVWELIRPREYYRLLDSTHDAAEKHCQQELYDFYMEGLRNPLTPHRWRVEMARWFHCANPTLEALQASEFLFRHPEGEETWDTKGDYIGFLKHYLQTGDPHICELALEYARRMGEENKRVSKQFFDLIIEYGGEAWVPYLEEHLETPHLKRRVEYALIERSGESEQYYRDLLDTSLGPGDQLKGVSEMLRRFPGANDEQLVTFLRKIFSEAAGHESKLQYLSWLFLAGDPDAVDYFEILSEAHPEEVAGFQEMQELLQLLKQYDIGKDVDVRAVLEPLVHAGIDGYRIDAEELKLSVLEAAGLYFRVSLFSSEAEQISEFSANSGGTIEFKFATPDHDANVVRFEHDGAIYEFDIPPPQMSFAPYTSTFDPHPVADALNAVLVRNKNDCRYFAHNTRRQEARFLFGPPELVAALRDDFGVEFMAGTEELIDPLED